MDSHIRAKVQAMVVIAGIVASAAIGAFFMPVTQEPIIPQAYSQSASIYPTIKVTGDASKTLVLDQATIIITVQSQSDDMDELLEDHMTDIRSVANTVGFANMTRHEQSIELLDSDDGQSISYATTSRLAVRTFPVDIDRVITGVRQFNNTTIEEIILSVPDSEIDAARVQLTEEAIDEAENRANEIADMLGLEVRKILSIEVLPSYANSLDGEISYRGVKVVSPDYYENISGEFVISVIAEFELRDE